MARVVVIGLDCLAPELVFGAFRDVLPTFSRLGAEGLFAPLRSVTPPITVPAWASMVTGVDPGTLGLYGFHDRADASYEARRLASSNAFTQPPLWSLLTRAGRPSRVIGVPATYPARPLNGAMVTCFLTPPGAPTFTYPPELGPEVHRLAGGYVFDVPDFRTDDETHKERLITDVARMTERRFRLARAWLTRGDWHFFMMVEMGPDRLHHAFWRYLASDHPRHVPGHRFANVIRDYYVQLDGELARLLDALRSDDVVLVASDHGARSMLGAFAINDWLVREGFLVLREPTRGVQRFEPSLVDWPRSRAWADGGYVGRVHLNVRGREAQGCVAPDEVGALVADLTRRLAALGHRALEPARIYRELRGRPPALLVEAGGLALRCVASVGNATLLLETNDTGPDDANHAQHGVLILRDGRGARAAGRELSLLDVAPTVLERLGEPVPRWMQGEVIG